MPEDNKEKSFAELLEETEMSVGSEVKVGDRISGQILKIGKDTVYIDTGTKIDGVADRNELLTAEGEFPYQEGDTVELFVVSRKQNEIRLARSIGAEGGVEQLQQAMERKIPVEGRVKETCKGGFRVRIMQKTAFCPLSQIDIRPVDQPESLVGETFRFLITRIEEGGRNIVVSRRALLEKEQAESLEQLVTDHQPGDILEGKVTRLAPYGAFVEVAPGLEGLVHISEMSWSKSLSPEEIVSPGDTVKVKLLNVQEEGKKRGRIELSMKQTEADPWEDVASRFEAGSLVTGTVTRTAPFGVFVEIAPGIEGLVHISEMSYVKRVHKPEEEVSPGDRIPVMIKNVDTEAKRIALSMRDAEGDPWLGVSKRYAEGQVVEGVAENQEKFGLFVRLEPGVVGLVPTSKIERSSDPALKTIKPGDSLQVAIESIDEARRRITLAPAEDTVHSEEVKSYASQNAELGSLGHKLKQALQDKKES
jgi:small subunit ribosomal protein S1